MKPTALVEMSSALGIDQEQLIERVVDKLVEGAMCATTEFPSPYDDDNAGECETVAGPLGQLLAERAQAAIDAAVDKLAAETIVPKAEELLKGFALQQTTKWGEKRGGPVQFTDYLVQRAEGWFNEPVDFNGKTKEEDSYSWKHHTTRFSYMVNQHFQYRIETAMKELMKKADGQLKGGLQQAVLHKLDELTSDIKIRVYSTK